MPQMSTDEWASLTPACKARLMREFVIQDDIPALAAAVKAYLLAHHGWTCVVYEAGLVEFGIEGEGPAGMGRAATTEDAICLAALRAVG